MKNIYKITMISVAVIALTAIVVIACNKESLKEDLLSSKSTVMTSELQNLYNQLPVIDYGNINVIAGNILQFESKEHYRSVVMQLNDLYEAWNTLFVNTYGVNATEEEFDSIQKALEFSAWLPMIKFEETFNITTNNLRYLQCNIEEDWLDNGGVGLPDIDNVIIDPAEQTLLNQYREACIGDTICQVREDATILIPIAYSSDLPAIRSMSTSALQNDKRLKVIQLPITCYERSWDKSGEQDHPANDKKFIWEFEFHYSWFFGCSEGVSKMTNYKKNNRGNWVNGWAVCALGQSFKVYYSWVDYNNTCDDLGERGRRLQTPINLMSRTIRSEYINPDNTRNRIDPANSKIECRHNGWTFTYNIQTGAAM